MECAVEAEYEFDANSNVLTVTDVNSQVVAASEYNELNQPEYTVDQLGRKVSVRRNNAGEPVQTVDPLDNVTASNRTASGLVQSQVLPDNSAKIFSYTAEGWIDTETNAKGDSTQYIYDPLGRVDRTIVNGVEQTKVNARDGLGRPTSITEHNSDGDVTTAITYRPDSSMKESESITGSPDAVSLTYDEANRLKTVTYPSGHVLEYVYNPQGYVGQILFNAQVVVIYEYDAGGNITNKRFVQVEPDGYLINEIVKADFFGRQSGTKVMAGTTVVREQDFERNPDGRLDRVADQVNPLNSRKYVYDNGYRLTGVKTGVIDGFDIPDPQHIETFSYDIMGNINGWTKDGASGASNMVPASKLTPRSLYDQFEDGIIDPPYAILHGNWWEIDGNLNTTDPTLSDIQVILNKCRINSMSARVVVAPGQLYSDPVEARIYANSCFIGLVSRVVATPNEDPEGKPVIKRSVRFEIGKSNQVLASSDELFDYGTNEFNLSANITRLGSFPLDLEWTAGTRSGQLSTSLNYLTAGPAGLQISRAQGAFHVKIDNVRFQGYDIDPSAVLQMSVYQYTDVDGLACIWDANGNLLRVGDGPMMSYDSKNRMTGAGDWKYIYDHRNRRIGKKNTVTGAETRYVYHGDTIIAEYNEEGDLLREFIDGISLDEHICMVDYTNAPAGDKYFYILDTRNGVDKIINEVGTVVESYEYAAYGETTIKDADGDVIPISAVGNIYGFQGRQIDNESGLYYFRNRMFSPLLKRFISMDPLGFSAGSMNLYETFGCDPVNRTDPWGLLDVVSSGVEPGLVNWDQTDYLAPAAADYFYADKRQEGEVIFEGSRTSFGGAFVTLGINTWRDARRQGNIIADKLAESSDSVHRFIAHSQGCRISLEAVYRYAYYYCSDKANVKDQRPMTIRMVLTAPKVRESYLRKVIHKVKELAPNIDIKIMIISNPGDWVVPSSFTSLLSGQWEPEFILNPEVRSQIQVTYQDPYASLLDDILDHGWQQHFGAIPIIDGDKDAYPKRVFNEYMKKYISAFLQGEPVQIDRGFRLDLERSGVLKYVDISYNF